MTTLACALNDAESRTISSILAVTSIWVDPLLFRMVPLMLTFVSGSSPLVFMSQLNCHTLVMAYVGVCLFFISVPASCPRLIFAKKGSVVFIHEPHFTPYYFHASLQFRALHRPFIPDRAAFFVAIRFYPFAKST